VLDGIVQRAAFDDASRRVMGIEALSTGRERDMLAFFADALFRGLGFTP
jgi:hypothetical protein